MQMEPTGTVTTTQTSYVWDIEDFAENWECKPGEAIKSPDFTTQMGNSKQKLWNIFLFFHGDCNKYKSYISIYAQPQNNTCEEKQLRLSILDKQMKKVYGIMFYDPLSSCKDRVRWGSSRFIHQHVFLEMVETLQLTNLTILCEIVVSYTGAQSVMHYQEKKMHTDLGALLENEKFSDLTLIVEGNELKTHKNVLAARSATFAKAFEDGTIKSEQTSFEISDVSCKIFKKILQFIYTEKAEFESAEALNLLAAANRYKLNELKILCEEVLGENINIGNVLTTHIIAHFQDAEKLKERTMNFIISNAREILDMPEYKFMVDKYPQLLQEIYKETILRRGIEIKLFRALELLAAANKFKLSDLKILCEEVLGENVNIGNAITIHIAAHEQKAMNLKERTMNFIISNAREMLDMPEYKYLAENYPKLLRDIYEETIKRGY